MTNETILTHQQVLDICCKYHPNEDIGLARSIEQAVMQSSEIQALRKDEERLNWLADPKNNLGNVQLPTVCVERNPHSLRDAIDEAMEYEK